MRLPLLLALSCSLLLAVPIRAGELRFSTETRYEFMELRLRDQPGSGTFVGLAPTLSLSYLSPLKPGSDLRVELRAGLAERIFQLSRQGNQDLRLVLRSQNPYYRLSAELGRSNFHSAASAPGLETTRLDASTTDTAFDLTLRQPAFPTLNYQWLRSVAHSGFADVQTETTTTTRRLGAFYDFGPLRFRLDDSSQLNESPGSPASEASSRRTGATLETALTSRLDLFADAQFSRLASKLGGQARSERTDRLTLVRLSALLTPSVIVDAEVRSQLSPASQGVNLSTGEVSSNASTLRMRSELLPGTQLNLGWDSQRFQREDRRGKVTDTSLDLLSRLNDRNSVALSFFRVRTAMQGLAPGSQSNYRASWSSQLSARADAALSWDRFSTRDATSQSQATNANLALTYRPDLRTTIGFGLLSSSSQTLGPEGRAAQKVRALSLDFSWLPTSDLALGGQLSLSRLEGTSQARLLMPSANLRWQLDSRTSLNVNWNLQRATQQTDIGASVLGQTIFVGALRRRLSSRSSLDGSYDTIRQTQGPLALERIARMTFSTGW